MKAKVIVFPSDQGHREVEVAGESATLQQVLEAAQIQLLPDEKADLAINGVVTGDMQSAVTDGAVVTKTKRVKGG